MTCSTGFCERRATIVITFIDARKLSFCPYCAVKIGGEQQQIGSGERRQALAGA